MARRPHAPPRRSPARTRELRRQWIAAGLLTALAILGLYGLYWRQQHPAALRGPFPARRLNDRPLPFDPERAPATLRVLRTGKPYRADRCAALYRSRCVESLRLEEYVRGVVFAEEGVFHRSLAATDLRAGADATPSERRRRVAEAWKLQAVAARSYALYAVLADKYRVKKTGFHITDTTWDQVYVDARSPQTDAAVRATRGQVLVDRRGRLLHTLYSASCGGRGTRSVVRPQQRIPCHPECRRFRYRRSSHYVGMCQWGSLLFALEGHSLADLAARYYPHGRIATIRYE